jgi:hypothetical protein
MAGSVSRSSPAEIAVRIDPSITVPTSPGVTCSTGAGLQLCEASDGSSPLRASPYATDLSVVIRFTSRDVVGESLNLELISEMGAVGARAFVRFDNDGLTTGLTSICPPLRRESMSGTLALTTSELALPEALHGKLELALLSGGSVSLEF